MDPNYVSSLKDVPQQSPAFGRGQVELEDLSPGGLGTFVDAHDMETALAGGFAETRQAAEDFDEHRDVPMRGCCAIKCRHGLDMGGMHVWVFYGLGNGRRKRKLLRLERSCWQGGAAPSWWYDHVLTGNVCSRRGRARD